MFLAIEGFVNIFEDDMQADPSPNPLQFIKLKEEEQLHFLPYLCNIKYTSYDFVLKQGTQGP